MTKILNYKITNIEKERGRGNKVWATVIGKIQIDDEIYKIKPKRLRYTKGFNIEANVEDTLKWVEREGEKQKEKIKNGKLEIILESYTSYHVIELEKIERRD